MIITRDLSKLPGESTWDHLTRLANQTRPPGASSAAEAHVVEEMVELGPEPMWVAEMREAALARLRPVKGKR